MGGWSHRYEDFEGRALRRLLERIKIKMREQDLEFFVYGDDYPDQYLYLKSRYLAPDSPGYERQLAFDRSLEGLGAFDFSGFGPPAREFDRVLEELGLSVEGYLLAHTRTVAGGQKMGVW